MAMTGDRRVTATESTPDKRDVPVPGLELLAPTFLEFLLTRSLRPDYPVRYAGMRLSRWRSDEERPISVVCGLAGSLVPTLQPGDVFIPETVTVAGDEPRTCDPELVESLCLAAESLGFRPNVGRLITAREIVTGSHRDHWAERGFDCADMELGLLPEHLRIATVRVILDAPGRSISSDWVSPGRNMLRRNQWSELFWLARVAPKFARRAARVADLGLRRFRDHTPG